jgi:hypothetical protein
MNHFLRVRLAFDCPRRRLTISSCVSGGVFIILLSASFIRSMMTASSSGCSCCFGVFAMGAPSTLFPITNEHAAAIGRVAVNWSLVEGQVAYLIMSLLSLQASPSHAVTAELGMLARLDLVETLIGLTGSSSWTSEWAEIDKEIDDLRVRRNDVIHAEWRYAGRQEEHESIRIKARGRVSITLSLVPTSQIANLSKDISCRSLDLF